jgi:ubiquinone/menaquinone biosynthesis C-methylase UbiE
MAREQLERDGLTNLELRAANAERVADLPQCHFHAATIRWGLMYMAAPVAALENARRALLPGGPLVAALWAEPERVPYFTLPRRLLERYRPVPAIDPEAPGTFRYADLERIVRDFDRAGLHVEHVEEMEIPVFEATSAAEMVEWVCAMGLTRLLDDLPEADQRAWEQELTSELERSRTDGVLHLGGVTRLVRARAR